MDYNVLQQLVSSLGFPIVACVALAFWVKYTTDANHKEIEELRKSHEVEIKEVTKALNDNTLVIQKLYDKLDSIVDMARGEINA